MMNYFMKYELPRQFNCTNPLVVCWPTCAAGVLIVCGLIAIAQMFDLWHVAIDGRGGRRLAYNNVSVGFLCN